MTDEPNDPPPRRNREREVDRGSQRSEGERRASSSRGREGEGSPVCDLCGSAMLERHCRFVCLQCGYQRDCSDP